jgi:hypothetical protein
MRGRKDQQQESQIGGYMTLYPEFLWTAPLPHSIVRLLRHPTLSSHWQHSPPSELSPSLPLLFRQSVSCLGFFGLAVGKNWPNFFFFENDFGELTISGTASEAVYVLIDSELRS